MDEQDLLRKVSALLKKAEGTDNENESNSFFEKAHELMLRFSLDEARVREAMGVTHGPTERPIKVDYMFATYDHHAKSKAQLLFQISVNHSVKMLLYGNRPRSNLSRPGNEGSYSQWCCLVGYESDIEAVKMLYISLLVQATRFGAQDWREYAGNSTNGRFGFLTGHMMGFASRIGERFRELNVKVVEETSSSALVVRKDDEVNEAYREFFPRTSHSKSRGSDVRGQIYGTAAANRADLGQKRAGGPSHRLIKA